MGNAEGRLARQMRAGGARSQGAEEPSHRAPEELKAQGQNPKGLSPSAQSFEASFREYKMDSSSLEIEELEILSNVNLRKNSMMAPVLRDFFKVHGAEGVSSSSSRPGSGEFGRLPSSPRNVSFLAVYEAEIDESSFMVELRAQELFAEEDVDCQRAGRPEGCHEEVKGLAESFAQFDRVLSARQGVEADEVRVLVPYRKGKPGFFKAQMVEEQAASQRVCSVPSGTLPVKKLRRFNSSMTNLFSADSPKSAKVPKPILRRASLT